MEAEVVVFCQSYSSVSWFLTFRKYSAPKISSEFKLLDHKFKFSFNHLSQIL